MKLKTSLPSHLKNIKEEQRDLQLCIKKILLNIFLFTTQQIQTFSHMIK